MFARMMDFVKCLFLLVCCTCNEGSNKVVINYLLLVPWPDVRNRSHAGYDAGPDLLTGARVAVQEINERTDLLNGYKVRLIEAGHEACGLAETDLGLQNLVNNSINPSLPNNVVVVLGLFCSTSTDALSPVAGREGVDLIQLSASNSPIFNLNTEYYPHLWRFLQSANIYVDMMIALMERFDWKRVAVISDLETVFHSQIATTLVDRIQSDNDKELVYQGGVLRLTSTFEDQVLSSLKQRQARIIFITASGSQIANILCKAAESGMLYPNNLWVIADFTLDLLLDANRCDNKTLLRGIEGSILSYFNLEPEKGNQSIIGASNETYATYLNKYFKELDKVKVDYNDDSLQGDPEYSSLAYDQVWAFSLAVDQAIKLESISIEEYGFGRPQITAIIEEHLINISFQGASGYINFNTNHEVSTPIDLFQVRNGVEFMVGKRLIFDKPVEWTNVNIIFSNYFDDELPVFYQLVHPAITSVMVIGVILLFIVITIMLILMNNYRERPEIKASSFNVSLLIFFGNYLLVLGLIINILLSSVECSTISYSILCNSEIIIVTNGYFLITVTILVKLQRISRIFHNYDMKYFGWRYSNCALVIKVIVLTSIADGLIVIMLFQPLTRGTFDEFMTLDSRTVIYRYHFCRSPSIVSDVPLILVTMYSWIVVVLDIYFASKLRHVNQKQFKNTKAVNIFAVLLLVSGILFFALSFSLRSIADSSVIYIFVVHYCIIVGGVVSCQMILFFPKVFVVVKENII